MARRSVEDFIEGAHNESVEDVESPKSEEALDVEEGKDEGQDEDAVDHGPYDPERKDEDVLHVEEVAVAGVIIDDQGNRWSIPAEDVEDRYDLGSTNPFQNLKYDPRFHYQLVRNDRVAAKQMEQFVPVTKAEVKMPEDVSKDFGSSPGSIVQHLDCTMMKIPMVIRDRRQAARVREAQRVKEQTEPTPAMLARRARQDGPEIKSSKKTSRTLHGIEDAPVELKRSSSVRPTISY